MTRLTPEQADLVEQNLGLVPFVVRGMGREVPDELFEDACQDGVLGLMRAVQKHDPAKGTFAGYAYWWIRQAVRRGRGQLEGSNWRRQVTHQWGDLADAAVMYEHPVPLSEANAPPFPDHADYVVFVEWARWVKSL